MKNSAFPEMLAAIFLGLYLMWAYLLLSGMLVPDVGVRDIGTPCREHHGVRQYSPPTFRLTGNQPEGFVVCRDGTVGEVRP